MNFYIYTYLYINRKHYHSLNVQMIFDEHLKIMNVNSRFPGSTHDSFIWSQSRIEEFLRMLSEEYMGSLY
ncbi:unnamed protein product [Acanthoscelides obtectus]|uniref:DDE Tnp4 domain-containing protein n=1 Tax=Acanthoscelides obtectus TaxID=200917 RepID=A0A9P0PRP0_ACAOB|nr:unnamed protein product [Acanthoscelides obtectus]CAK1662668.1 hypothetical protein AOBTE_LOCUS23260 [Acanthoscelides obtectus]